VKNVSFLARFSPANRLPFLLGLGLLCSLFPAIGSSGNLEAVLDEETQQVIIRTRNGQQVASIPSAQGGGLDVFLSTGDQQAVLRCLTLRNPTEASSCYRNLAKNFSRVVGQQRNTIALALAPTERAELYEKDCRNVDSTTGEILRATRCRVDMIDTRADLWGISEEEDINFLKETLTNEGNYHAAYAGLKALCARHLGNNGNEHCQNVHQVQTDLNFSYPDQDHSKFQRLVQDGIKNQQHADTEAIEDAIHSIERAHRMNHPVPVQTECHDEAPSMGPDALLLCAVNLRGNPPENWPFPYSVQGYLDALRWEALQEIIANYHYATGKKMEGLLPEACSRFEGPLSHLEYPSLPLPLKREHGSDDHLETLQEVAHELERLRRDRNRNESEVALLRKGVREARTRYIEKRNELNRLAREQEVEGSGGSITVTQFMQTEIMSLNETHERLAKELSEKESHLEKIPETYLQTLRLEATLQAGRGHPRDLGSYDPLSPSLFLNRILNAGDDRDALRSIYSEASDKLLEDTYDAMEPFCGKDMRTNLGSLNRLVDRNIISWRQLAENELLRERFKERYGGHFENFHHCMLGTKDSDQRNTAAVAIVVSPLIVAGGALLGPVSLATVAKTPGIAAIGGGTKLGVLGLGVATGFYVSNVSTMNHVDALAACNLMLGDGLNFCDDKEFIDAHKEAEDAYKNLLIDAGIDTASIVFFPGLMAARHAMRTAARGADNAADATKALRELTSEIPNSQSRAPSATGRQRALDDLQNPVTRKLSPATQGRMKERIVEQLGESAARRRFPCLF
jgi:hypothetical protein